MQASALGFVRSCDGAGAARAQGPCLRHCCAATQGLAWALCLLLACAFVASLTSERDRTRQSALLLAALLLSVALVALARRDAWSP
jgi:hypothetical protein